MHYLCPLVKKDYSSYLEFLRWCLDASAPLPTSVDKIDWTDLYRFARRQTVEATYWEGIERLDQSHKLLLTETEVLTWMARAKKIERRKVVIMRVLIVFFIALSLMIALNPPQFIAQLMGISWGALAGAFLAPFMLGLYWKGVTRMSVWACFVWGVGLTVVNMVLGNPINPIDCGAIAMLGGFVVVTVVSLVTSKMKKDTVDAIFKCYK